MPEQALATDGGGDRLSVLSDPDAAMMTAIAGGRPSRPFAAAVFDRNGRLLGAGIDAIWGTLVVRRKCAAQAALYEPGSDKSGAGS